MGYPSQSPRGKVVACHALDRITSGRVLSLAIAMQTCRMVAKGHTRKNSEEASAARYLVSHRALTSFRHSLKGEGYGCSRGSEIPANMYSITFPGGRRHAEQFF